MVEALKRLPGNNEAIEDPIVTGDELLAGASEAVQRGVPQPTNLEMRCVFDSMTAGVRDHVHGQRRLRGPVDGHAVVGGELHRSPSPSGPRRPPAAGVLPHRRMRGPGGELSIDAVITAIQQVGLTLVVIAALSPCSRASSTSCWSAARTRLATPLMLLAPAFVGLLVLFVYPLLWEFNVSFTGMSLRNFRDPGFLGLETGLFLGIQNYIDVFTRPVLKTTELLPAVAARR